MVDDNDYGPVFDGHSLRFGNCEIPTTHQERKMLRVAYSLADNIITSHPGVSMHKIISGLNERCRSMGFADALSFVPPITRARTVKEVVVPATVKIIDGKEVVVPAEIDSYIVYDVVKPGTVSFCS